MPLTLAGMKSATHRKTQIYLSAGGAPAANGGDTGGAFIAGEPKGPDGAAGLMRHDTPIMANFAFALVIAMRHPLIASQIVHEMRVAAACFTAGGGHVTSARCRCHRAGLISAKIRGAADLPPQTLDHHDALHSAVLQLWLATLQARYGPQES